MKIKTKTSLIDYVTDRRLELAQWVCVAVIGCTFVGATVYFIAEML